MMPYIEPRLRDKIDHEISDLAHQINDDPELMSKRAGVINYTLTRLINYLYNRSYTEYNEAIGVLECVKQELYRRQIALYEDEAKEKNGDVYDV